MDMAAKSLQLFVVVFYRSVLEHGMNIYERATGGCTGCTGTCVTQGPLLIGPASYGVILLAFMREKPGRFGTTCTAFTLTTLSFRATPFPSTSNGLWRTVFRSSIERWADGLKSTEMQMQGISAMKRAPERPPDVSEMIMSILECYISQTGLAHFHISTVLTLKMHKNGLEKIPNISN